MRFGAKVITQSWLLIKALSREGFKRYAVYVFLGRLIGQTLKSVNEVVDVFKAQFKCDAAHIRGP